MISGEPSWPNAKVFSLAKMMASSENSYFVISDSDVLVGPDFLRNVMPPLLDPKVGLVTCMYRGIPTRGLLVTTGSSGDVGRDAVGSDGR